MVLFEKMYFCSDLHINNMYINQAGEPRGVILFERTQFKTIQEHDTHIYNMLISWAQKHPDCGLWILGDFGDTDYLYWIDEMRAYGCEVYFLYGNHDSASDFDKFKEHFNEVYRYPTYITNRVLLSHEPQYPMPVGELNIMGHLHSATLNSPQHICVSINTINYSPMSYKSVAKRLGQIEKASFKFLQEPYRELYHFTRPKEDVVMDKYGNIKLKESIELYNRKYGKKIS